MIRRLTEAIKIPETVRIPLLGGWNYRLCNCIDNYSIKKEKIKKPLNTKHRDIYITASLTSYPARIQYVHLAIKSLMLQSCKPDRIILWLADSQFNNRQIPTTLSALEEYGLEIKWCDDLYGHKKYFWCVKNQHENEVVITFDDDIIYPIDAIKRLIKTYRNHPGCLVCERAQAIDYSLSGELANPGLWKVISNRGFIKPSYSLNPSPGGGCLLPYHAFFEDATDTVKIRELAYKNDDLWYMFMAAENGTRTIKTKKYHKPFSVIDGSQTEQMAIENVVNNYNQVIMKKLIKNYPVAYNRIITDSD